MATPAYAFSAPGPYCIANTAGFSPFVTRPYPSAIPTPTRSWRQIMGRIPAAAAASITGVVGKQLRNSTPSLFKISAMASIVIMSSPFFRLGKWLDRLESLIAPSMGQSSQSIPPNSYICGKMRAQQYHDWLCWFQLYWSTHSSWLSAYLLGPPLRISRGSVLMFPNSVHRCCTGTSRMFLKHCS